jgi:hypothetical protein
MVYFWGNIKMGNIPAWHKGRLVYDYITGEWAGLRSGKITIQDGHYVLTKNVDRITDKQRAEMLKRRRR